jgi:hypothetical protein
MDEENKLSKERAEEGRKLLARMPKLESQRSLRKKYQQLVDGGLSLDDFEKARTDIMDSTKLKRSMAGIRRQGHSGHRNHPRRLRQGSEAR